MKTNTITFPTQKTIDYSSLSLQELLICIVQESDADALAEFHNRSVFKTETGKWICFSGFLNTLSQQASSYDWKDSVVEKAREMILAKFLQFPDANGKGVDCRKYFQAVLSYYDKQPSTGSDIENEFLLCSLLQRFLCRHQQFSLREAARTIDVSRYTWTSETGSLQLLIPRSISGSERRVWLEKHIPQALRTNRREVQALIDSQFSSSSTVSIEGNPQLAVELTSTDAPAGIVEHLGRDGLIETLVSEKQDRIDSLRPAVRRLGNALGEMIRDIIDGITSGETNDLEIAKKYGITPSTFSRFAGSNWRSGNVKQVPDLWKNLASLLSTHVAFREAAQHSGVWPTIESITGGKNS